MRREADETPGGPLTPVQRLCVFDQTSVTPTRAMSLVDAAINFDFLRNAGVRATNLRAASLSPLDLHSRGATTADAFRTLGFCALDLMDVNYATQLIACFGAKEVSQTFVSTPSDALSIAGSEAVRMLGLTTQHLLECCIGAPTEAHGVLSEQSGGLSPPLEGVSATTLLDCGMRAAQLQALGLGLTVVAKHTGATAEQLRKMGFRLV